jgi:WD40 repeat protein
MIGAYRAVKIVARDSFLTPRPFERELSGIKRFESISRLHEGFLDILQVGINEERGYFYYIMELGDDAVTGQQISPQRYVPKTLARELSQRGNLSLKECVQLGLAISLGLADLHKHGLVHRDIKPSNILFVNGVPRLADIGLVAGINEPPSYVGTEGFIAPEGPGTVRSDLYSLGKVLYEAATGKDRQDFPELPASWSGSPEYDGLLELNEVVLKACQPEPGRRYTSAWDLHSDLLIVLNGKSLKRLRTLERRMTHFKRVAGIAALGLAAASLIFYQAYREWNHARDARELRQQQVSSAVFDGRRAMESGDLLGALPYFAEALRLDRDSSEEASVHRLRFGSTLAQCPKLTQLWPGSMRVDDAEFSPDGNSVVVTEHYYGKTTVYDLKTGVPFLKPFGPSGLTAASYSPDGRYILTSSQDVGAMVWDAHTLTNVLPVTHASRLLYARFAPGGQKILGAYVDGFARVFDAKTGRLELELKGHTDAVTFVTMSPDRQRIATASKDGTARVWDAETGRPIGEPLWQDVTHNDNVWVLGAAFSPDGKRLVTAGTDHRAKVWDLATKQRVFPLLEHEDVVSNVEFSPDGRLILTASYDGTVRLWRSDDLQPVTTNPILRHNDRVMHATFSPDGRLILTACLDGTVRVWDLAGRLIPPVPMQRWFSPDASRYLTISNGTLQVWDSISATAVSPPIKPANPPVRAELSYDGRFLLAVSGIPAGEDSTNWFLQGWSVKLGRPLGPQIVVSNRFDGAVMSQDGAKLVIWDGRKAQSFETANGAALAPALEHSGPLSFAKFNPKGDRLVTVESSNVFVWDPLVGKLAFPALKHPVRVGYLDFSTSGLEMVTCCSDLGLTKCFAQVWRVADGQPLGDPLEHGDGVIFAAFSRDGRRLVTTGEDNAANIWEAGHGTQIGQPLKHRDLVFAAALSSRARYVATACKDHTARIWDSERDDPLTPPLLHPSAVVDVKFLPDDKSIVTADREGNTWIWPLKSAEMPLEQLISIANLLSGTPVQPVRRAVREKPEPVGVTWQILRGRYGATFSTSVQEVVDWHRFQAEDSEQNHGWSAAIFHLKPLLSLTPTDPSIAPRIATDAEHLAAGD